MCAAQGTQFIKSRPFDYADTITLKYPRVSRQLALRMIDEFNNITQATHTRLQVRHYRGGPLTPFPQYVTHSATYKYDSVEQLVEQTFPRLITSTGICPLHVQCQDCRATFTVLRTNPTVQDVPRYCIWCSSKSITVTLPSTNDTADLVLNLDLIESNTIAQLAADYDIPIILMQELYKEWGKQARVRTIADWMLTDSVQLILNMVHAKRGVKA